MIAYLISCPSRPHPSPLFFFTAVVFPPPLPTRLLHPPLFFLCFSPSFFYHFFPAFFSLFMFCAQRSSDPLLSLFRCPFSSPRDLNGLSTAFARLLAVAPPAIVYQTSSYPRMGAPAPFYSRKAQSRIFRHEYGLLRHTIKVVRTRSFLVFGPSAEGRGHPDSVQERSHNRLRPTIYFY